MTVHNKGVGGQNSRQGRARFAGDVLALKPDYVFIYFGLNDTLNEPAFLSEKEYIENLGWMVDQARSAGIEPVICTIHPAGEEALLKRHKKASYGTEGPNGLTELHVVGSMHERKAMMFDLSDVGRRTNDGRIGSSSASRANDLQGGVR